MTQATVFELRPFELQDAEQVAALVTASYNGQWVYQAKDILRAPQEGLHFRWVALRGAEVVATLNVAPLEHAPQPYNDMLRIDVAGDSGAYSALYLRLLAWLPEGAWRLLGVTREDNRKQMDFFAHLGFRNAWQSWGAHLPLSTFQAQRFEPLQQKLFLAGYEIEPFVSHASQADWQDFYALQLQGAQDAPRHPATWNEPLSFAQLQQLYLAGQEQAFVVRYKGHLVASTRLVKGPNSVESDLTVTLPPHRGQGLATALKAYALAWAQSAGYQQASTGGAVVNLPMLKVNTRLGYQPEAMWVSWEQRLG